jgi:hypothetical protein
MTQSTIVWALALVGLGYVAWIWFAWLLILEERECHRAKAARSRRKDQSCSGR